MSSAPRSRPSWSRAPVLPLRPVAAAIVALWLIGCDLGIDAQRSIRNEAAHDIWIVVESPVDPLVDDEAPDGRRAPASGRATAWTHVPAGEVVSVSGPRGCASAGRVLVADGPRLAAVVDERELQDEPWCENGPWVWRGPGDRE